MTRIFNLFNTLILGVILILLIASLRGEKNYEKYKSLSNSSAVLSARVLRLEKESVELDEEINRINSSPDYAKKLLKGIYNKKEEGEDMVIFPF